MTAQNRPSAVQANVLLITAQMPDVPSGGRALLSRLIHDAMFEIFESFLVVFELRPRSLTGIRALTSAFRGHIDGIDDSTIYRVVRVIQEMSVGKVLIDGSNLGTLAAAIKTQCPGVEVSTFFHNCEARFFFGAFRQYRSLWSLGVLIANYLAERRAVRCSDKLICLSERDSALLRSLYGRAATHVSAMAMRDQLPSPLTDAPLTPEYGKYALFVGGTFYANQQGIEWFVEHVARHIAIKIYIVGKGFEQFSERLQRNGNVEVIGAVQCLVPWYLGAHFVIAPIFDGSGMKTKVAEALMFGKRVVGTPEAFSGYEPVADRVGTVCETATQFISAVEREAGRPFVGIDPELRSIYEERYSFNAACDRLEKSLVHAGNWQPGK